MHRSQRIAALLLALPGLTVPFLPFFNSFSPLEAVRWLVNWILLEDPGWFGHLGLLAAPSLLAIPIAIWQVRKLFAGHVTSFEFSAIYVLATAAMISVLGFTMLLLWEKGFALLRDIKIVAIIFLPCWLLIIANLALLWRNHARSIVPDSRAEGLLLGAYLPNAVLSLLYFGFWDWSRLQVGAWIAAIACVAYVISIVLALRSDDASPSNATK